MINMVKNLEYVQISDFGDIRTGKTPKTENTEYWNGNVPFITPTDIPGFDSKKLLHTERTISVEGVRSQKKTLLPPNSLCVSCIATIGKLCLTSVPSITNQQINSIIVNDNYNPDYLFYVFRYYLPYLQLIGGGTGSGTSIINKNKFSKLKYPIFKDKSHQAKIANVLSNYDQLIENNNKRIKLLESMAGELYKEWFVRFRFPGYRSVDIKKQSAKGWCFGDREDGQFIPVNWNFAELIETAEFKRGKNITSFEMVDGEIPVIAAGLEPSGYNNQSNVKGYNLTVSASGANAGYLAYHLEDIWAADCSYYQNDDNVWFVYNALKFLQPVISNMQVGSAQPHVYAKNINRISTIKPSNEWIQKYEEKVNPIYLEIKNLKNKNGLLTKQRDALLPRLMSGKLSVEGKEVI